MRRAGIPGGRWAIAAIAALSSCSLALGLDKDWHAAGSSSGATGSGGSSSTSATGSGGAGGGAVCSPLGSACGPGMKCSFDASTGERRCIALADATQSSWSACATDAECPLDTLCDPHNGVCKPICNGSCSPCVPMHDTQGAPIAGASVCVASCEPELSLQCGQGATCAWDPTLGGGSGAFDCFQSGTKSYGDTCSAGLPPTCVSGYVCALGQCRDWCVTSPDDCVTGYCAQFDSFAPKANGTTYGFCFQ